MVDRMAYAERKVPEAPRLLPQMVAPQVTDPNATVHRYVTNMARHLRVKIVAIADDADDIALCRAAMSYPEHWDGDIAFMDWYFTTPHLSVARLIDKRIRMGMIKGVSRDIASIMMRCAQCEKMFTNTPRGMEEYSMHLLTDHPDNVLSYLEPMTVSGTTRQGNPDRVPTEEEINPPQMTDEVVEEYGDDFLLAAQPIPGEVLESLEKDNAGTENTERVSKAGNGRRSG